MIQDILLEERTEELSEQITKYCLFCLRDFTQENEEISKGVLSKDLMRFLIDKLNTTNNWDIVDLALRVIEHLGSEHCELLVNSKTISILSSLLRGPNQTIRGKTAFALSNLIAEINEFIDAILKEKNEDMIDRLFWMAKQEDFEVTF